MKLFEIFFLGIWSSDRIDCTIFHESNLKFLCYLFKCIQTVKFSMRLMSFYEFEVLDIFWDNVGGSRRSTDFNEWS